MYRRISDFESDWNYETGATLGLFKGLTDDKLDTLVSKGGRSLGRICWHIALTPSEIANTLGFKGEYEPEHGDVPNSAKRILEVLEKDSSILLSAIKKAWNDDQMDDEINAYGMTFKKGAYLRMILAHLIHHRGQATVLMRQAGLKVTGVCGPAKEEWIQYNLPPQE